MAQQSGDEPNRLDRRKARTRAALVRAAQAFIAAGNPNVPIVEITEAADVGIGSFYNHFDTKEQLFQAALEDAFDALGTLLDQLTAGLNDPAHLFAQRFRLFGRFHRRNPELSRVLLNNWTTLVGSQRGLAPRARRDIQAAIRAGRFKARDPELALVVAAGAAVCLGQFLHDQPDRDENQATDQVTEDLLRMLGLPAKEAHRICQQPLPNLDHHPRHDSAA